jgi:hypothetical protein
MSARESERQAVLRFQHGVQLDFCDQAFQIGGLPQWREVEHIVAIDDAAEGTPWFRKLMSFMVWLSWKDGEEKINAIARRFRARRVG